ncbi:MAG TPA: hypothetical protein VMT39_01585 [Candidatus Bathyarchaeia archaeon]|nr:hypothetical protein [Candidatus Bathyarchaeia archaeon]
MAARLGLSSKEVVDNEITALTSNGMIAPRCWVDSKNGNNYLLTVQYPEAQLKSLLDLKRIPIRAAGNANTTDLEAVTSAKITNTPTEVDHYQIRRVIDVYVTPSLQDLGGVANRVDKVIGNTCSATPGSRTMFVLPCAARWKACGNPLRVLDSACCCPSYWCI